MINHAAMIYVATYCRLVANKKIMYLFEIVLHFMEKSLMLIRKNRKRFIFSLGCLLVSVVAFSQYPQNGNSRFGGVKNGLLYGKIVDAKTNKPIDGATILLIQTGLSGTNSHASQLKGDSMKLRTGDSAKKFPDSVNVKNAPENEKIVATLLSQPNGDFSIDKLLISASYRIHISAVGYADFFEEISFHKSTDKDLGNLKLNQVDATLAGVTVTAPGKPFFEMGVDRKIFNVDKNIVSSGQTATELMKQIPSLNVDIDGNVTLRNASPTLFVDGRPTTLTLDQIPSDIIDKVEIITNPSAKFDASGGNAGILNIILKKNKRVGYNGGVRAGVDTKGRLNAGFDLNARQDKVNFFASAGLNQRRSNNISTTDRNDFTGAPINIYQKSDGINEGMFGYARAGMDYLMDIRNTFTATASFFRGSFDSRSDQTIDSTIDKLLISHSTRTTNSERDFQNFGGQLSFRHNFTGTTHNLTADINYNESTNSGNSDYSTYYFDSQNQEKYPSFIQKNPGNGYSKYFTVQSDYENQFTDKQKIEAGLRAAIRKFENISEQFYFDHDLNSFLLIPSISSKYKFTDQVFAGYVNYSMKLNKFSYQVGLRAESSDYNGTLIEKDSTFRVNFPISLFPSAFATYKINDKQDFQLNYSRRVDRPNFWQLLPFIDNSDPLNLSIGNPNLKPQFTNSFELNYNNAYKKGANFLATIFFKQNNNLITNFIYRDINPDTTVVKVDSVYYSTYINSKSATSFGIELTNRINILKIWDLTANVNFFHSKINSSNIESSLSNEGWSWFAKINNSIKLPKGFSIQLSGNYQAKTVMPASSGGGRGGFWGPQTTAQGYINPRYSADAAIKKDWTWKGGNSASLTLSVNDIFNTNVYSTYSESPYFTQTSERIRDAQIFRLNFNYRFGKMDVNLFKRKNSKTDMNGGQDMMGGIQ